MVQRNYSCAMVQFTFLHIQINSFATVVRDLAELERAILEFDVDANIVITQ